MQINVEMKFKKLNEEVSQHIRKIVEETNESVKNKIELVDILVPFPETLECMLFIRMNSDQIFDLDVAQEIRGNLERHGYTIASWATGGDFGYIAFSKVYVHPRTEEEAKNPQPYKSSEFNHQTIQSL